MSMRLTVNCPFKFLTLKSVGKILNTTIQMNVTEETVAVVLFTIL